MLHAGHSLGVQRFKMHRVHEPSDLLFAELIFLRLQLQGDFPVTVEGSLPFIARISAL